MGSVLPDISTVVFICELLTGIHELATVTGIFRFQRGLWVLFAIEGFCVFRAYTD